MGGGTSLEFPISLVAGDNGQLGIQLYNYIIDKYGMGYSGEIEEEISIKDSDREWDVITIDVTFSIMFHGESSCVLRSTGILS